MEIIFSVNYLTHDNQAVAVSLYTSGADRPTVVTLGNCGGERWQGSASVDDHIDEFEYAYSIVDPAGSTMRREWGPRRLCRKSGHISSMKRIDFWHDKPDDLPLRTSAFVNCFSARRDSRPCEPLRMGSVALTVDMPEMTPGYELAVCGSADSLGNWNPAGALRLTDGAFPLFATQLDMHGAAGTEYKFIMISLTDPTDVRWEEGPNRRIDGNDLQGCGQVTVECPKPELGIARWRGAGVAIPVFSIRTRNDFGVGDFEGLKAMARWCAATGQRVIQVLPVNDTTMTGSWLDSYPYNANSTFALHPMYLHLPSVARLLEPARVDHYAKIARRLNALPEVDYEAVTRNKDLYARELYAQEGAKVTASPDFVKFVNDNKEWLMPYAAFRLLRDRFKTAWMDDWGEYATYDPVKVARLIEQNSREINYHCFVQYFLARQLREALDYARSLGVTIKGDIPIGISRTSVDAWRFPRLFNLDCQAGAPPDFFAVIGQNWGFPTYNWDEMKRDGYSWWRERFHTMSQFFDLYRIDHVLGFFRIWQIPCGAIHGLLGYFNPALPLSPEAMAAEFGFTFLPVVHTSPFMTDESVDSLFGEFADTVRERWLTPLHGTGRWRLRPEVDTQRKVAALFATLPDTRENREVARGLTDAIDDVLFIADPYQPGTYHPRINGHLTTAFKALDHAQQQSYSRLYHNFFYERHNEFWKQRAMEKLPPLINATRMLACAEDLGMIPACVPDVLHDLEVLSLEIQRMPKDFGQQFADTARYPYFSVCTTSTHDMSGMRLWWTEDSAVTQAYFNNILHRSGNAPAEASPEICSQIAGLTLNSPSMLAILPLQDWLATDGSLRRSDPAGEVINIPAQSGHYWRYRMHVDVETLIDASDFNNRLRDMIVNSGRNV